MSLVALAAAPSSGTCSTAARPGRSPPPCPVACSCTALTNVPEALLQRQFSVRRRLIVGPSVSASFAVVAVTVAALGLGVWSMVLGSYASSLVWVLARVVALRLAPVAGDVRRTGCGASWPVSVSRSCSGMVGDRGQKTVQAVVTGRRWVPGTRPAAVRRADGPHPGDGAGRGELHLLVPGLRTHRRDRRRFRIAYLRALRLSVVAAAAVSAMIVAVGVPSW